jgi:hypothetical protein
MTGGPEEVVSTRLEPGLDPIAEACKRGSIMLIIRLGNIDLEAPNTPPMDAPNPYQQSPYPPGHPAHMCNPPFGAAPGMPGPAMAGGMMPPGMQPPLPPGPGVPMMMPMVPQAATGSEPANASQPAVVPAKNTATPASTFPPSKTAADLAGQPK